MVWTAALVLAGGCAGVQSAVPGAADLSRAVAPARAGVTAGSAGAIRAAGDPAMPPLIDIPSPNHNDRPAGTAIDAVVWHHTASRADARATARFFANPAAQVSSHYIVDRAGEVVRCVADARRAWHAGPSSLDGRRNVNDFSLGIEICNVGDSLEPYPNAQIDQVIVLTAHLLRRHGIPALRITRHRDVAVPAGSKIDTSDNFPWDHAIAGVKAVLAGQPIPPRAEPQAPPGYDPARRTHEVHPGETWESIADLVLDNPARGREIRLHNGGGDRPRAGSRVRIPVDFGL
ncbi:MAG: N-acetylmuramoyl-L-alanine amidase [Candidatus Sericytochromatia bacterium]|nr:N-acetylmuramoyl-L-alanine amidase [Candidatus Tanganyikabacteria bacterium]